MSSAAVVIVREKVDFAGQAAALAAIRAHVASASEEEALDAVLKAKVIREWLRIAKGAAELSREATHIECLALRRLGLLRATDKLSSAQKGPARYFAAMSEDEFDAAMLRLKGGTAHAIYKLLRQEEEARSDGKNFESMMNGRPVSPVDRIHSSAQRHHENLHNAARTVLDEVYLEGKPVSMSEAVDELRKALDLDNRYGIDREPLDDGLRQLLLSAMSAGESDDRRFVEVSSGREFEVPRFVTYFEDEAGWVRIPWHNAGIQQLEFMAALRRTQANDVAKAAEELEALHTLLSRWSKDGDEKCSDLMTAAKRAHKVTGMK